MTELEAVLFQALVGLHQEARRLSEAPAAYGGIRPAREPRVQRIREPEGLRPWDHLPHSKPAEGPQDQEMHVLLGHLQGLHPQGGVPGLPHEGQVPQGPRVIHGAPPVE